MKLPDQKGHDKIFHSLERNETLYASLPFFVLIGKKIQRSIATPNETYIKYVKGGDMRFRLSKSN